MAKKKSNKKTVKKKQVTEEKVVNEIKENINLEESNEKDKKRETSLLKELKVKKVQKGVYTVTKTFLVTIFLTILIALIGGYTLGISWDIRKTFNPTEEVIQSRIENNLAKEIVKLNKKLPKKNQLDEKPTYYTDGKVNDYEYYQYVAYTKDQNAYVVWIVDKDSKKVISVWAAEQHQKDSKSVSQIAFKEIVNNLYRDRISAKNRNKILKYIKEKSSQYINDTKDFAYLQQYSTDNLKEGTDYVMLYEVDFFTYDMSDSNTTSTTKDTTTDNTNTETADSNNKTNEK